jgi:serine phosphatase RsbU (regulator of sigma subunit)
MTMTETIAGSEQVHTDTPDGEIAIDLARSRRTDRIVWWIVVICIQAGLLNGLVFALRLRSESEAAGRWVEAQRRAGHHAVSLYDPLGDAVLLRGTAQFWGSLEIGTLWAMFALIRRSKERLVVTANGVRCDRRFVSFSSTYGSIDRLSVFQRLTATGFEGSYSIQTRDGRRGRFQVQRPDASNAEIGRALSLIEERTGLRWVGRGERQKLGFRAFWREFKVAAGVRKPFQAAGWILQHAFFVRPDAAGGLDVALLRWSTPFFMIPALATLALVESWIALSPMLVVGSDQIVQAQKLDFMSKVVVVPEELVAFAVVGWISTCLGVNSIMTLLRSQERKREVLESEMAAARQVQQRLLPAAAPDVRGFDIAGVCTPANDVGGDYYDYLSLSSGNVAIAIADVSGKGLPAGLLMTLTKGALKTGFDGSEDLRHVLCAINRTIRDSAERGMFVSMALAKIDIDGGSVQVARAGHNPPLLVHHDGAYEWIAPTGLALGLDAGTRFEQVCATRDLTLDRGDTLVLYTDGVTEAMNNEGAEYGDERLAAVVAGHRSASAATLRDTIVADVRQFRAGAAPNDDLTIVLLKRT